MRDDNSVPPDQRRKDGRPFKEGNVRDDGSYAVGKNRAPASGQFAVGDGRARGRRAKGSRNADTEFEEELNRKVTVAEAGKKRRVSKHRASMIRLLDNGYNKGQTAALIEIDRRQQRLAEKKAARNHRTAEADAALLDEYIREMLGTPSAGPHLTGDPEEAAIIGTQSAGGSIQPADGEQGNED